MCNIPNNLITVLCSSESVKLYVVMRVWWPNYIVVRGSVFFFFRYFQDDCVLCVVSAGW
jgi:hypothetical protein